MKRLSIETHKYLSWFYLLLACLGGILPTLANIDFFNTYGPGFDINLFIELANSNPAASSLSRDLLIGATAVTVWIVFESKRLQMKYLWVILLSSFTIAFAFAAPLFLCLRERRIIELINQGEIV
tara:strand:+ start:670 stop:1044 length:375 start_codon:yes stop_codon:yes gene_type:complete